VTFRSGERNAHTNSATESAAHNRLWIPDLPTANSEAICRLQWADIWASIPVQTCVA
jgi:hypothetical protein